MTSRQRIPMIFRHAVLILAVLELGACVRVIVRKESPMAMEQQHPRVSETVLGESPAYASESQQGKYGIYSTTLTNGMDVIAIENPALPLVTVEIAVKNGAYTEPPELDGLSHLYEHMFFKGNRVIASQERYMQRLRELGADWNGTTSEERVNYYLTVHKKNLYEGAEFMRNALLHPLFKEEELRREWPVVLGEFDRAEAQPMFHLRREVDRKLWSKYFSRKNTIGDRDVIFNATRRQMREIQHRYYIPNNSALIIGGDVHHDEVFELAQSLFGAWRRGDDPNKKWPVPRHPPLESTRRIAVIQDVRTITLDLAWHGPAMDEDVPSTFAADVLSFILAQPDSNFHKALVDSGLFDVVMLSYSSLVHTGPIHCYGITNADRFDLAFQALRDELAKIEDPEYLTDEQIQAAKNMLEIGEIYGREQTSAFCHTIAYWWCTGGLDYYLDYIDNLRAVTREDIVNYYRRYLKDQPRIEAAMLTEEDLGKVEFGASAEVIRPASGSSIEALDASADSGKASTTEFDVDGLPVVLRRVPGGEIVVAQMVLIGGLPYYGPENAGRELLLLESLDKGSAKFSKEEVNRQLARTGASMSASAGYDYSAFILRTLKRDLDANFALFADALARPRLDAKEVALDLERRINSIRRQEQNPDAYIPLLGSRNFFKGHPYAVPPSGSVEAVEGLTAEDLRRIHDETFLRSRMKLFVVGDLNPEELTRLVREGLGGLPRGEFDRPRIMRQAGGKPRLLIEPRDLPTNYIFGCFDAPNMEAPDYPAFKVAISILSNRLFEEVRTKRNLTYAVAAQLSRRLANYGVLYVTAVKPDETLRVMYNEVDRIIDEPVPAKVLADKIEEMITDDLISNQTSASQCAKLVLYDMNGGGWSREAEAIDRLRSVTPAAIRKAAGKYLRNFNFAVLGHSDQIDRTLFTSR